MWPASGRFIECSLPLSSSITDHVVIFVRWRGRGLNNCWIQCDPCDPFPFPIQHTHVFIQTTGHIFHRSVKTAKRVAPVCLVKILDTIRGDYFQQTGIRIMSCHRLIRQRYCFILFPQSLHFVTYPVVRSHRQWVLKCHFCAVVGQNDKKRKTWGL